MPTPVIREIAAGLMFPEGPIAMPDGSILLSRSAAARSPGSTRKVASRWSPSSAADPTAPRSVPTDASTSATTAGSSGTSATGWCSPAIAGGLQRRLDPGGRPLDRVGRGPLPAMRRRSAQGAQRSRLRLAAVASGSPTTARTTNATATAPESSTRARTGRRSSRSSSRSTGRTESGLSPARTALYVAETHDRPRLLLGPRRPRQARSAATRARPTVATSSSACPASSSSTRSPSTATGNVCVATILQRRHHRDLDPRATSSSTCRPRPADHQHLLRRPRAAHRLRHAVGHRHAGGAGVAATGPSPRVRLTDDSRCE